MLVALIEAPKPYLKHQENDTFLPAGYMYHNVKWPFVFEVDWRKCGECLAERLRLMTCGGAYSKD